MGNEMITCILSIWRLLELMEAEDFEKKDCEAKASNEFVDFCSYDENFKRKFKVSVIDVYLPSFLIFILKICSNGNIGLMQLMVKDLLMKCNIEKEKHYCIKYEDFGLAFPYYPSLDDYEKKWDEQKKNGINLVDTREYWEEIYH